MPLPVTADTVHGIEGELIMTVNGNVETLGVESFEANFTLDKAQQMIVGRKTAMNKITGSSIAGTMTILYQHISRFVELANQYKQNGTDPRFTLRGKNNDPSSTMEPHQIMLYGCSPDEIPLIRLATDDPFMKIEIGFTAEDYAQL